MTKDAVNLTKDLLLSLFNYDREKGTLTWKNHWAKNRSKWIGKEAGYTDEKGYRVIRLNNTNYPIQQLIWFIEKEYWPKEEIDHINGLEAGNQISNLREVTIRQNQQNRKHHRAGRLVGATFVQNRWRAQIQIDGKKKHLGSFDTELGAHLAYAEACENMRA